MKGYKAILGDTSALQAALSFDNIVTVRISPRQTKYVCSDVCAFRYAHMPCSKIAALANLVLQYHMKDNIHTNV